jgi:hypothetical protein
MVERGLRVASMHECVLLSTRVTTIATEAAPLDGTLDSRRSLVIDHYASRPLCHDETLMDVVLCVV